MAGLDSLVQAAREQFDRDEKLWDELVAEANAKPPPTSVPEAEPWFAMLHIDGDWSYSSLYVCAEPAMLVRLQTDKSVPENELIQELLYEGPWGQAGYQRATLISIDAGSESDWWAKANHAMDEYDIPERLRFRGDAF